MKLSKLFTLTIVAVMASWNANAQDIHFSQFGTSNLTLNPATTGVMTCNARVSVIYRNQWTSALKANAFNTFAVGGEAKFNAGKKDFFGIGLNVSTDVAGASKLASTQGAFSAAYIKKIGGRRSKDHFLVAGAQIGFIQHSIKLQELRWGMEWSGTKYDPSLGSGEVVPNANNTVADINAGLMWFSSFGKEGKSNVYAGIAFQHLTKSNISFLSKQSEPLWTRYTVHGGADIRIQRRLAIVPVFMVASQGPSLQMNVGTALKFDFSKRARSSQAFSLGVNVRAANMGEDGFGADAIIPKFEVRFSSHRIGLAYDINISKLAVATGSNGAFELGYIWTLCGKKGRKLGCPTF